MRKGTRQRVLDSIEKLGYTVNISARSLKTGSTGLLGLAIFNFSQPFAAALTDTVIEEARQSGYGVIISTYGDSDLGFPSVIDETYRLGADGWIFFADRLLTNKGADLKQRYPVVLTGDYDSFGQTDSVTMPNVEAMRETTVRLLDGGVRDIALLGSTAKIIGQNTEYLEKINSGTQELRTKGFVQAFADRGLDVNWNFVIPTTGMVRLDGVNAAERLLNVTDSPQAVICMNDAMAFGAMYTLQRHGLRIPQDVQVIGFDNVSEGEYSTPSLTTIDPYIQDYAAHAVKMLVERIGGYKGKTRNVVTDYRIVNRDSTLARM
jgi:DNA-binding LacI/PurR family transcriptional regulator